MEPQPIEDAIQSLTVKIGQLKREYEQYFLGSRPREPVLLKGEVNKLMAWLTNTPIQNTAQRFKFSSLCSRYQAYKRQWEETQRKIEAGTYDRHRFHADRRQSTAPASSAGTAGGKAGAARAGSGGEDIIQAYLDARSACGQSTRGMTRDKVEQKIAAQRDQLAKRFGADARFQFRVAVEEGKVRLKARRVRE